MFLPWLRMRTPCVGTPTDYGVRLIMQSAVNLSPERTPRSRYNYNSYEGILVVRPLEEASPRNWLTSTDGTAAWLLATDTGAGLHPFTGAFTPMPAYQDERRRVENPRGNICCDGTVFLYNIFSGGSTVKLLFRAAILRRGDTAWTVMKTKLDDLPHINKYDGITAVYHNGKILVCLGLHWCILTLEDDGASRGLEPMPWTDTGGGYWRKTCYALEYQGQLLLVTVLFHVSYTRETPVLLLVVHAWDEDKVQWLTRDGRSMGDGVFFLGSRASFALDAAQLGLDGGCAYLVFGGITNDVFRSVASWADLPPDLLGDVSGRLHNAVDFTCFHAVCTTWRDALPTPPCGRPAFLPCLLTHTVCKSSPTACDGRLILHTALNLSPEKTPPSRYCYEDHPRGTG
ncbi:hypothetical protein ZWY2020_000376 [Hordeum vulgare]|nr:hypothetical protein ZWY2020_000376 [Hordeum vulgare]